MKQYFLRMTLGGIISIISMTSAAYANNSTVETAIRSRSELSVFYERLVSTGVLSELKEDQSYTVFAPTNDAFAKLPADKYPCLYSDACKPQLAKILRNHIVLGEQDLGDLDSRVGGLMSMFAINDYHLIGDEPYKNSYEVDGQQVLSKRQLWGNLLYTVDGILSTPRELVEFSAPIIVVAHAPGTEMSPKVPVGTTTVPESAVQPVQ